MNIKKKLLLLLSFLFLNGCVEPTALMGPAFTVGTTGNIYQAGLSYGSSQLVTSYTGKTPTENLQQIILTQKEKLKNIKKKTLESQEFYVLIKNKIEKKSGIIKLSNQ